MLNTKGFPYESDEEMGVNVVLQQHDHGLYRATFLVLAEAEVSKGGNIAQTFFHIIKLYAPYVTAMKKREVLLFLGFGHLFVQVFAKGIVCLHSNSFVGTINRLLP